MNKRQEPRLRFKGFTGAWEEKKVIDFSPLQRGFDLPVSKITEGDYPVVFSNGILKSHNQYKVKGVGIVTGRSGTIGEVTFVEKDFWPHNTALWVTNFFGNNPQFVFHFLKNFDLSRFATGSGVPTLNRNDVHNQTIYVPKFEEQTAIGFFFRTLDDILASYKDNLSNYQSLKATMLSKMFPKAGQTVPEIRLDGFEGEWEKGTIGEFGSFYYGKSAPKWSVTDEATTPCVRYGELYTKFSTKIDKIYSYTSIPKDNLKLSSGNEVLVPRVGENPLDFANGSWLSLKGVAIGEMISVYNTPNNPLFIAYYFNAKMKKEFAKRVEGGSVANLYYTYLENISISVPSLPEQQAIGAYFLNLDNLINSHQEKISQLETLKKKLLQDMFI